MEFKVIMHDRDVGICELTQIGLYWDINCRCEVISNRVERLYVGEKKVGVLEKDGQWLTLKRRVSRSSFPELPPKDGVMTLYPVAAAKETEAEETPQTAQVAQERCDVVIEEGMCLYPYKEDAPCPHDSLFCFMEVKDGFWRLPESVLSESEN